LFLCPGNPGPLPLHHERPLVCPMLFNSFGFLLFFGVILAAHYSRLSWTAKKRILLAGSYLFYAAWSPPFVLLLWLSTVVDFSVAKSMHKEERAGRRKLLLLCSLAVNLGMLGFFKYGALLTELFVDVVALAGVTFEPATWSIVLPVGISFYTFQTLSYTIDVYRRQSEPEPSFQDFALFVTFFPQLVAGPIVRPQQLLPQFKEPHQADMPQFVWGAMLLTWGLFQKAVLADAVLSLVVADAFGSATPVAMLDAWAGVLAFSGQIFFDFSGYSMCAIGVALCLGFSLPDNFRCPYAAVGFSDFWRRWHISLSTWLRDYLYIPLGGNRGGVSATYRNLVITMLLGGLWHGASWRFVVWGGVHGLYLVLERLFFPNAGRRALEAGRGTAFLGALVTFFFVSLAWVFFAAGSWAGCVSMFGSLFGLHAETVMVVQTYDMLLVGLIVVGMLLAHWRFRETRLEDWVTGLPTWLVVIGWSTMAYFIIATGGGSSAFIYFQF
jgi:alginate O-acetyltransferase complex protein AlgI